MDKFGMAMEDWQIQYVPHGVSEKFKPLPKDSEEIKFMKDKLGIGDKKFVVFWNNRNIRRKNLVISYWLIKSFVIHLHPKKLKMWHY